jgi:2'-5' RNA ligase
MTRSPSLYPSRESAAWRATKFADEPSTLPERTGSLTWLSSCDRWSAFLSIVRLFLAVNLSPEVRRAIAEAVAPLRAIAPELSWVKEEQLHLTVKFLGEQPEEMASKVASALRDVGARNRVIDAEVGGIGAFPNFRRPRVVWIGVTPEPKLELLHHDVESTCESLGLPVEGKPFRPHLTLARVRPRASDARTLRELSRAAKDVSYVEEVIITGIDLMESELTTTGSRYRVVVSTPLRV